MKNGIDELSIAHKSDKACQGYRDPCILLTTSDSKISTFEWKKVASKMLFSKCSFLLGNKVQETILRLGQCKTSFLKPGGCFAGGGRNETSGHVESVMRIVHIFLY